MQLNIKTTPKPIPDRIYNRGMESWLTIEVPSPLGTFQFTLMVSLATYLMPLLIFEAPLLTASGTIKRLPCLASVQPSQITV